MTVIGFRQHALDAAFIQSFAVPVAQTKLFGRETMSSHERGVGAHEVSVQRVFRDVADPAECFDPFNAAYGLDPPRHRTHRILVPHDDVADIVIRRERWSARPRRWWLDRTQSA